MAIGGALLGCAELQPRQTRAFAMRRRHSSDAEVRAELERGWELERLGERVRDVGHELVGWIRSDNESVTLCGRCDARTYVHTGDAMPVRDGEALALPGPGARRIAYGP